MRSYATLEKAQSNVHSGKGQQLSEARTNGAAKEMGGKAREVSQDQVIKGLVLKKVGLTSEHCETQKEFSQKLTQSDLHCNIY